MIKNNFDTCKVYTPASLAKAMIQSLGPLPNQTWLEPSYGKGVFLKQLKDQGIPKARIVGVELEESEASLNKIAQLFCHCDYLQWSRESRRKFDRVIGNPPYVSVSKLPDGLADSVMQTSVFGRDCKVPRQANIWYAFLCSSLTMLKPNGCLAFVLPASWDYAAYASDLRTRISSHFEQFFVIRSRKPLFTEVQDGSVILVGLGFGKKNRITARVECEGLKETNSILKRLPKVKRTEIRDCVEDEQSLERSLPTLGDFIEIKLGGVTGQVSYFLLDEEKRLERKIPKRACLPVLSKSNHIVAAEISKENWESLMQTNNRVWLFRPSSRMAEHPEVINYFNLPLECGGCDRDRYKISSRDVWYQTPMPSSFDGFVSGMSGQGPFLSFKKMDRLSASNTLYVFTFKQPISKHKKYAVAMALLSSFCQVQLKESCRRYPSGLPKFEPSDLKRIRLPYFGNLNGIAAAYRQAVNLKLRGQHKEASQLADSFFFV